MYYLKPMSMKRQTMLRRFIVLFLVLMIQKSFSQEVSFYMSMNSGCEPFYTSMSNMSTITDPVTYEWYLNGSYVGNYESMFDTTLNAGKYSVKLVAIDSMGNNVGEQEQYIDVQGPPKLRISSGPNICLGDKTDFSVESMGEIYETNWMFSDGKEFFYQHHVSREFQKEESGSVTLITYGECGEDTIVKGYTVSATAKPMPKAFTHGGDWFCPGDEIKFGVQGDYQMVSWDLGPNLIKEGREVLHAYPDTGKFKAIATVTNGCNQTGKDTAIVSIGNDVPVWADFHYWFDSPNNDNCPGIPVRFNSNSSGQHHWDFGDGSTSDVPYPTTKYADQGNYEVKLIVNNACGNTDTSTQQIYVEYRDYETLYEGIHFRVEGYDYLDPYMDTLKLCPNEDIKLSVESNREYMYEWIFGDGTSEPNLDPIHAYQTNGTYKLQLLAHDYCMRSDSTHIMVEVNSSIKPNVQLMAVPMEICPGEEVYFFNEGDGKENNYTFDVDFGDGNSANNITEITDMNLHTLANHSYQNAGFYEYSFSATNLCGNTVTRTDTISVTNNPELRPFNYVENSTMNYDEKEPEDWSIPKHSGDHQLQIPVVWPEWQSGVMNDTLFVYFWYGQFDPMSESEDGDGDGPPDGMIMVNSNSIVSGDTFTAYIPISQMDPPSVGIAVGWSCNPSKLKNDEPETWGMPSDGTNMIHSIPISVGGISSVTDYTSGNPVTLGPWDGLCNSERIRGDYKMFDGMYEYELRMWSEGDKSAFEIMEITEGYHNTVSSGFYTQTASTLTFKDTAYMFSCDTMAGEYAYMKSGDSLSFTIINDPCTYRMSILDSSLFMGMKHDHHDGGYDASGCPGDPVKFKAAGGISYKWNFGDGATSTEQYPLHAYSDTGHYEAYVEITNGCGNVDTMYTPVNISDHNTPQAWFHMDMFEPIVGDTIHFYYDMFEYNPEIYNDYTFLWEFGDGAQATVPNPVHHYNKAGEYEIKLTVTNGCGSNSEFKKIFVGGIFNECELDAKFSFDVVGDSVYFKNNSFGSITNYEWSFGDLNMSNEISPAHLYAEGGIYEVCLTVFDSVTNCVKDFCQTIQVGTVDCFADFVIANHIASNNEVHFANKSVGGNKFFWSFGDLNNSLVANPKHIYPKADYFEVCLAIEDTTTGCFNERCKTIYVGVFDSTECGVTIKAAKIAEREFQFTPEVTGNVTNGFWDFGDGVVSDEFQPVHKYMKDGKYNVCATVMDSLTDCKKRSCKEIIVGSPKCDIDYSAVVNLDTINGKILNVVDFKANGTNVNRFQWKLGDGTLRFKPEIKHTYLRGGIYTVCLFAKDTLTGCAVEVCKDIKVPTNEPICKVDFDYAISSDNKTVTFSDASIDNFTNWNWKFGDYSQDTGMMVDHTYTEDGVYEVCVSAIDSKSGCFSKSCQKITIKSPDDTIPILTTDFSYVLDSVTNTATFMSSFTGNPTLYYWTFDDGGIEIDLDTVNHLFKNPRVYNVCLHAFDDVNDQEDKYCEELVIKQKDCSMDANFDYFVDASTGVVKFKDLSNGNVSSRFWNLGNNKTSTSTNPINIYSEPGMYFVTLSVRDNVNGCADKQTEIVQVGTPECNAFFEYEVDPQNLTVSMINSSTNADRNSWRFGKYGYSTDTNPTYTFEKPGLYNVSLNISDETGLCNSVYNEFIQVGEIKCNAKFDVFVDSITNTAYFNLIKLGNIDRVNWDFGDGGNAQAENVKHTYAQPGIYPVRLNSMNTKEKCSEFYKEIVVIGSNDKDCEAAFSYEYDPTNGKKLTFFDQSIGEGLMHIWNFGDRSPVSIKQNPMHSYQVGDYYNVCLTVINDQNIKNTHCEWVLVEPDVTDKCKADFTYNIDSANLTVNLFDNSSGSIDSYLWDFGNQTSSSDTNPVITYDSAGFYLVNHLVQGSSCSNKAWELINVSKGNAVKGAFGYAIDSTVTKATNIPVEFIGLSSSEMASFVWDFGDGTMDSTTTSPIHYYTEPGTYDVCFTIEDPITGQSDKSCQKLKVGDDSNESSVSELSMATDWEFSCYPQITDNEINVKFTFAKQGNYSLHLLNTIGTSVKLMSDNYERGSYERTFNLSKYSAGMYFLVLTNEVGKKEIIKIIIQ